ncbi:MAG: radical SAM family heme chaperone HemW [Cypionkella sp.]|uniref:radical SAM family heme chaperone HemW n=1 Tax=Cypionkella sp. TaxID=2811411 RepID=UPI002ABA9EDC|nr:radical SAM family heme chaperone HemW [Cypionkella sp.]MDZ4312276.1 radical SAM family heme chaperone HemW [Cypionkella sp.]
MEDWQHGGFGLYLHWPYCESKCPYCDFNSHVATQIDQSQWQRAYLSEIDRLGQETQGRILNSVFFGGGTPSLMAPDLVAAIIERIRATWPMSNDPEITLEANPGSVEAGRFRGFQQAGVTRVSMGMQAMNDEDLRKLGRKHTAQEARQAFDIARSCFDRVSFDLIYARQDQTLTAWREELGRALELAIDHLSLYQLTIEDGTAFADRFAKGGLKGLPSEDLSAEMFEATQELCEMAGLPAYEVSNHAKAGCESRHNLIYWRGGDYIGIGPGAHGRMTLNGQRCATEAPKSPALWLGMVQSRKIPELPRSVLTMEEHSLEYLLMSLRLSEGLDLTRYQNISGKALNSQKIQDLSEISMVETHGDRLRTTPQGRMVLNAILRDLATC